MPRLVVFAGLAATAVVARARRRVLPAPGAPSLPGVCSPAPTTVGVNVTPSDRMVGRDGSDGRARPVQADPHDDVDVPWLCRHFGHEPTLTNPARCYCGHPLDVPEPAWT